MSEPFTGSLHKTKRRFLTPRALRMGKRRRGDCEWAQDTHREGAVGIGGQTLDQKHLLLRHSMSWKNRCAVASTVGADLAVRASPLEVYLFQA